MIPGRARGGSALTFPVPFIAAAVAAAFLVAPSLTGCGNPKTVSNLPPNVAQVLTVTARDGRAPDFTWKDPGGNDMSFGGVRAKATLVNFWATWCAPCKKELPDLVELDRRYADRGFRVVGVATDRTPNAAELVSDFVKEYSIPYQILLSTQEIEDAFGNVRMMPTSFLVDGEGRIVHTIVGIRTRAQLEEIITPLL